MAHEASETGSRARQRKPAQAFRSSRVATPHGITPATVLVRGERIAEIMPWHSIPSSAELHDFGDLVLLPGLVDTHVHINEPGRTHWEGFRTATQAAASGGVTTLVDMPLNCEPETVSVAALQAKRSAASGGASDLECGADIPPTLGMPQTWTDWMTWGGIVGHDGIGGNHAEIPALIAAGVPGFKSFLIHSGIDGFAWTDEPQLRKSLAALQGSGRPLLVHAELAGPVDRATALLNSAHEPCDWRSYSTYLASRPGESELEAIQLLLRLAAEYDTPLHIVHLATAQALPLLKEARAAGLKITVETCPHYLWFAAEEIPAGATEYKCAPPIRTATNREALWQGLRDGIIDLVATDHSPCPPELKKANYDSPESGRFDRAWGGIASLGLALSVLWTGWQQRGGTLDRLSQWLAAKPAKLAGLAGQKGTLAPGCDADIAIFDPDAEWTVTESDLHFRHRLTPYGGATLRGRVTETWLRGERIFARRGSECEFAPTAQGRELKPNPRSI